VLTSPPGFGWLQFNVVAPGLKQSTTEMATGGGSLIVDAAWQTDSIGMEDICQDIICQVECCHPGIRQEIGSNVFGRAFRVFILNIA
jgi:hypothetical protein